VILHHNTNESGLFGILISGLIKPDKTYPLGADESISAVWLCDQPDGWMRREPSVDAEATTYRITVDVSDEDVIPWNTLKTLPGFPWALPKVLEDSARRFGLGDPDTWYVVGRPIPSGEWRQISIIGSDQVIWTP
jgi:hypothetical protein